MSMTETNSGNMFDLTWDRQQLIAILEGPLHAIEGILDVLSDIRKMSCPVEDTPENEKLLDAYWTRARALWLAHAMTICATWPISPSQLDKFSSPLGGNFNYSYERFLRPKQLEIEARNASLDMQRFLQDDVFFANGMASILTTLSAVVRSRNESSANALGLFGGYFETPQLLQYLSAFGLRWREYATQDEMHRELYNRPPSILYIEPIRYLPSLDSFSTSSFVDTWNAKVWRDRPPTLLVDTTLTGDRFPIQQLLARLRPAPQSILLRSGSKLDQQGLEIASVGIASLRFPPEHQDEFSRLTQSIGECRNVFGTGLTLSQFGALSTSIFLSQDYSDYHDGVFKNNAWLAKSIRLSGRSIKRIVHPTLHEDAEPWSCAPYVLLETKRSSQEELFGAMQMIRKLASSRNLSVTPGSGFGFRSPRYETVFWDTDRRRGYLKVAAGCRNGPALRGLAEILTDIASFDEIPMSEPFVCTGSLQ